MADNSESPPSHWIDGLTSDLLKNWPEIKSFNCNCGISVSGKQHVGRLRGEIILTNAVVNELKERGYSAIHYLILYTADPWKAKDTQRSAFSDPRAAKKYQDWRLVDVPDPSGQSDSWINFYWKEFGDPLPKFGKDVNIIRTHELYSTDKMKATIKKLIKEKDRVREILNKYRGENPFPEDWIPFNPLCTKCNKIGTTKALEVDLETYKVRFLCNSCGTEDWSDMQLGKLTWRLEWLAIWYVLNVHFEPYGKDHATPGGSRDSCIEVLESVLDQKGPYGFWNEWVGYSEGKTDFGDMTSSGFIGFTPTHWLQFANPEILKYMYLKTPPRRRIVLGLDKLPIYVNEYDRAERIYHGIEEFEEGSELKAIQRSMEITHYNQVPPYLGFQLNYGHAIILSQLVSADEAGTDEAIQKLISTEILNIPVTPEVRNYIHMRLNQARSWVNTYGPPFLKINIPESIPKEAIEELSEISISLLLALTQALKTIKWTEENIKETMITVRETEQISQKQMNNFFSFLYQIFLGMDRGPRFAPFIAALDKDWVMVRLEKAIKLIKT